MTTVTKTKAKPAPEVEVPEIDPNRVTESHAGFAWRDVLVRMPEGATQDDLRNPKIWRRVQARRGHALRKLDHLFVLAHNESWAVRAVVTHATSTEAHLAFEKVLGFREQDQRFHTDGTHEVFWDGSGYGIRRVSDGVRTSSVVYSDVAQAVAQFHHLYPKRVA